MSGALEEGILYHEHSQVARVNRRSSRLIIQHSQYVPDSKNVQVWQRRAGRVLRKLIREIKENKITAYISISRQKIHKLKGTLIKVQLKNKISLEIGLHPSLMVKLQ